MCPSRSELEALTSRAAGRRRALIRILQDIRERFHWRPLEDLEHVADSRGGATVILAMGVARTAAASMDRELRKGPPK